MAVAKQEAQSTERASCALATSHIRNQKWIRYWRQRERTAWTDRLSEAYLDFVTRMDGPTPSAPTMANGGARSPPSGYD